MRQQQLKQKIALMDRSAKAKILGTRHGSKLAIAETLGIKRQSVNSWFNGKCSKSVEAAVNVMVLEVLLETKRDMDALFEEKLVA
jgi:hypothetical protein